MVQSQGAAQAETIPVLGVPLRIGRDPQNAICLPSPFVSRFHATITPRAGRVFIEPNGQNPTLVNGHELKSGERRELHPGDTVLVQGYILALQSEEAAPQELSQEVIDLRRRFTALLESLHDAVIRRLDPRDVRLEHVGTEEGRRTVVRAVGTELLALEIDSDQEVIRHGAREALRSTLLAQILGEAAAIVTDDVAFGDGVLYGGQETARLALARKIGAALGIGRDAREDFRKLRAGFDAAYDRTRFEVSPGLAAHLTLWLLRREVLDLIFGLGPLTDLLRMPDVSEIMVVARDQIYVEKGGVLEETGKSFVSDKVSERIIERIVAPLGRRIDRSTPMVDARLPDGSRVNAIIPPLALKGPCITIRKFSKEPLTVDDLISFGALDRRVAEFLRATVKGRKNIVVSGGTGSGKTTLLNALSGWIPSRERIVTIEDSAELKLLQRHVVTLEAKPANAEGRGEVSIRELVRNALRMRPDRIIVGECRGREALDMLQAMNTGHDGSMTSGHANSPRDMLQRLQVMVLEAADMPLVAIRQQIAAAVHLIVQQMRFAHGARRVVSVTEVVGFDPERGEIVLQDIFERRGDGPLLFTGYLPSFTEELVAGGHLELDEVFF